MSESLDHGLGDWQAASTAATAAESALLQAWLRHHEGLGDAPSDEVVCHAMALRAQCAAAFAMALQRLAEAAGLSSLSDPALLPSARDEKPGARVYLGSWHSGAR